MTDYSFVTIWRITAPINEVWNALQHFKHLPDWWKYVESVVELEPGDEQGIGQLTHITWKTALPYKLSFDMLITHSQRPHSLEFTASGELNGTGRWQLAQEGSVTVVRYDWQVSTTKRWMNVLAPLLRPAFVWNHNILMNEGGCSLARLLNARLLEKPEKQSIQPLLAGLLIVLGAIAYTAWMSRFK